VSIKLIDPPNHIGLCLTNVIIDFGQPVRIESLRGSVLVQAANGLLRALVPIEYSGDFSKIGFAVATPQICGGSADKSYISINSGVVRGDGLRLGDRLTFSFEFAKKSENTYLPLSTSTVITPSEPVKSPRSITMTAARVNETSRLMLSWAADERTAAYYIGSTLHLLPMDGTRLVADSPENRTRHFGNGDLIFVLRTAATFVNKLYQDSVQIRVGDLSRSDGETPYVLSGSDRIYLHPEGSHVRGQDVDIAYIETADGSIDWERNFWLLYSILDRTGVDLIMTAYVEQFRALAAEAFQAGLINSTAVGRFDSPKFQKNTDMNHDKHFHVSVRNSDNNYESSRFGLADDVYNCYIKLRPGNRGVAGNFCRSPF
jgi:hypothetical protein